MTPPSPRAWDQRLPPMLRIRRQHSLLRCSKGARGLFVLWRATGVFTGTTNSQRSSLRQRSNRYAIRAGRNLPDKEFRYLRTVIVTAAVYRGFNSQLAPLLLTFRHRAGVRPYTSPCGFAEPCVFDKQSLPPGLCHSAKVALNRVTLIPKLRVQFAEFLQHSSLKRLGILYLSTCVGFGYGLRWSYFLEPLHCKEQSNKPSQFTEFVTSNWLRNIHLIPIDYAFRPRLRGRLTLRRLALRRNPWTFGESVSHTLCRYSCQHSHFRYLQALSRGPFTGLRNAPLPRALRHTRSFGGWLEPRYIFGAGRLV